MKRFLPIFLVILISFALCACNQATQENSDTWQEQYDLGVRYLSEGNYAEAIIAFTTAIEIDTKRAPAYVGRGDAYIASGETEENLVAAQSDYEMAIELDELLTEAYLGLADVYVRQGNYDKALGILQQGSHRTGNNERLLNEMSGLEAENQSSKASFNAGGGTEFTSRNGYVEYNMLSSDEQEIMQAFAVGLLAQDMDALLELAMESAQMNREAMFFTMWQGYKVQLRCSSQVDDNDYILRNCTEIELRSENSMGYYAQIEWGDHKPEHDGSSFFDEVHSVNESIEIITCPCKDWAWNGEFNSSSQHNITQDYLRDGEKSISHCLQERKASGIVLDGMCDGITVETVVDTDLDDLYTSQSTIKYYCDKGKLLKRETDISGEIVTHIPQMSDGVCIIYGHGIIWHADEQSILDRLYW